jgi:hypothetical protein
MIRSACICVALGLAAAASTALATPARPEPVMMTDAQMDNVTGGVDGILTIVLQDSFNGWIVDFGGRPGNGIAKGMENTRNPHSSASAGDSSSNTFLFQVNVIADVNAAIAGGDATAGQVVGTQTITSIVPMPTQTLTQSASARAHGK